jgi:uncharacterized membrane protein YeaQ/YmgE (transglycosylase-associated protein family)
MGIIVAILIGALVGWLASLIMHTDSQQGALANIVIGIVGAAIGRWFFGSVLHLASAQTTSAFSLADLLYSVIGASVLIGILKLVRVFA